MRLHSVSLPLLMLLAGCGQPASDKASKDVSLSAKDAAFVQAFMSACVRDFENRDRVLAAAKTMRWKPITDPNMRKMLGPVDNAATWHGWAFKHEDQKLMLAITDTQIDRRPVKNCVLIGELDSVAGTKNQLTRLLAAKKEQIDEEGGQITEIWKFRFEDSPRLLSFIDAQPMGMRTLNAGVFTDWTKR